MKERFAYRSGFILAFMLLALLWTPTEQRSRCQSSSASADCGENTLDAGEVEQVRSFYSKYISAADDPLAVKHLMEQLLMQHNQIDGDSAIGTDEEENSTERPPTKDELQSLPVADESATNDNDTEENTTEKPPMMVERVEIPSTTPQPAIANSLTDVLNQVKQELQTSDGDEESIWEITTIHPQQLASPLDVHEHHFEATTLPPQRLYKPIVEENSVGQFEVKTQSPVEKNNSSSDVVNIPPLSKRPKKPTPTKRPHIIVQPQQLNSFSNVPPVSMEKIKTKPDEQISQLTPVDQDQDSGAEIQFEILNRPISTKQPPVRGNLTQTPTSTRPKNKKPINIIPETLVKSKRKPSAGIVKPQGLRKPTRKPVAASLSETDDYLLSALASISDAEENYVDEEENEPSEEENEDDGGEEEEEEEPENSEEDYQTDNSAEERENLDYSADASDVISKVIEEVAALI